MEGATSAIPGTPALGARRRKLIVGHQMHCPRCKKLQEILSYRPLAMIEEFAEDTTPVYRCPSCRWIFAPADPLVISTGPIMPEDQQEADAA